MSWHGKHHGMLRGHARSLGKPYNLLSDVEVFLVAVLAEPQGSVQCTDVPSWKWLEMITCSPRRYQDNAAFIAASHLREVYGMG